MNWPTIVAPATTRTPARITTELWPRLNAKPDADRVLPLRHELAGGVVDRGEVVPVVAVLDAGQVGGQHQAQRQRLAASCGSR